MHDLTDGHQTAYSEDGALVAGVAWTRQLLPFQASISGSSRRRAVSKASPTATHACADGHESPYKTSLVASGAGVGWMRQRLPSHRSASGSVGLDREAADEPTATHACRERHDTDDSTLISALAGFGVGVIVHLRSPTAWLDPPACAAPVVTIAVKPSKRMIGLETVTIRDSRGPGTPCVTAARSALRRRCANACRDAPPIRPSNQARARRARCFALPRATSVRRTPRKSDGTGASPQIRAPACSARRESGCASTRSERTGPADRETSSIS